MADTNAVVVKMMGVMRVVALTKQKQKQKRLMMAGTVSEG
jgi:hypothetical protein